MKLNLLNFTLNEGLPKHANFELQRFATLRVSNPVSYWTLAPYIPIERDIKVKSLFSIKVTS